MKNSLSKNQKIGAAASFILGMATVLVQACGSGSGSAAAASTASTANAICSTGANGEQVCSGAVTTTAASVNAALYLACQDPIAAENAVANYLGEGAVDSVQGVSTTSSDGTAVCGVQFTQIYETPGLAEGESMGRVFLGPSAGASSGLETSLQFYPYDEVSFSVQGGEDAGSFFGGCTPDKSVSGILYGALSGIPLYFQITGTPMQVPAYAEGNLYIGLNQSGTQGSGCMELGIGAQITRCIDSSGNTHPCPSS